MAFWPDGRSLFSVNHELVAAWDAITGKELGRREPVESKYFKFTLAARAGRVVEVELRRPQGRGL